MGRKSPVAKCGCWKDWKGVDHTKGGCECTSKTQKVVEEENTTTNLDESDSQKKEEEKKEEKK